jgi:hypothetical protein
MKKSVALRCTYRSSDYCASGLPGPAKPSRLLLAKLTAPFGPSTAPKFPFTATFTAPVRDYLQAGVQGSASFGRSWSRNAVRLRLRQWL